MRRRRSARLIVLNRSGDILLFRFTDTADPSGERSYWGTPGGGLEVGESFEQAAVRELREETGLLSSSISTEFTRREVAILLPTGEQVLSEERYFLITSNDCNISTHGWTNEEREVTLEYRWWSLDNLRNSDEELRPSDLIEIWRGSLDHET